MMYTLQEIELDIANDFQGEKDIIQNIQQDCRDILETKDIKAACNKIKILRSVYKNTQGLSMWFRKLVFLVIYNYLEPKYKAVVQARVDKVSGGKEKNGKMKYKTQTELLEDMGLVKDIFRKTHWNMYPPDMKARQSVYMPMEMPLNYAEVECNDVYRAMIHYMVCSADVPTDTFVEVFGKFGLPSLFCVNGYTKREVWVEDAHLINILWEAMVHNRVKVFKRIHKLQYWLDGVGYKEQKELIQEWYSDFWVRILVSVKSQIENICELAAELFFVLCFEPEYWLDSMLLIENEVDDGAGYELNMEKISHKKIQRFLDMTKEDFIYLAEQYKRIEIVEMNKHERGWYRRFYDSAKLCSDLLYIDIPKYIREYKRFNFNSVMFQHILKLLENYTGNWILTWKNYVQKNREGKDYSCEDGYIYTHDNHYKYKAHQLLKCLERVDKKLMKSSRSLNVFKYRNGNSQQANSTVFITNIDFPEISIEQFWELYLPQTSLKGVIVKETFAKFNQSVFKFDYVY